MAFRPYMCSDWRFQGAFLIFQPISATSTDISGEMMLKRQNAIHILYFCTNHDGKHTYNISEIRNIFK